MNRFLISNRFRCYLGNAVCTALLAVGISVSPLAYALETKNRGSEPHPDRGLYAIWYGWKPELLDLPFIRGGQVVVQWADVHPSAHKFDFSKVERKLAIFKKRGLKASVQINGVGKPQWLFGEVPHHPLPIIRQVKDQRGTLMYWHPRYLDAYTELIERFSEYLKTSQYKESILGIRMNFNALGTEHLRVPREKTSLKQWKVPEGMVALPYSNTLKDEYVAKVTDAYVGNSSQELQLFVRNNITPQVLAKYHKDFERGKLSWFYTSSATQLKAPHFLKNYQTAVRYTRPGLTYSYAESFGDAFGRHGKAMDAWKQSPPQWNYWRMLFDLHCGVSFIAIYGTDLSVAYDGSSKDMHNVKQYQDEFKAAYHFAAKYVGFHASPKRSPGAWVALRGGKSNRIRNDRDGLFSSDYTFLMERVDEGIKGNYGEDIGPKEQRFGAWTRTLVPGSAMRFRLEDTFAKDVENTNVVLRITYFDGVKGQLTIRVSGQQFRMPVEKTGVWKTAEFFIEGFRNTDNRMESHISITSDAKVEIHMIELSRSS